MYLSSIGKVINLQCSYFVIVASHVFGKIPFRHLIFYSQNRMYIYIYIYLVILLQILISTIKFLIDLSFLGKLLIYLADHL